jgi:hypothetical protein
MGAAAKEAAQHRLRKRPGLKGLDGGNIARVGVADRHAHEMGALEGTGNVFVCHGRPAAGALLGG